MSVSLYGSGQTVIQVAQTVLSTAFSSATVGSYVPLTGLSVSITPQSTTSKILVMCQVTTTDSNNYSPYMHIYRNGSQITPNGPSTGYTPSSNFAFISGGSATGASVSITCSFQYLDSPSSTSALTYQVYIAKPSVASSGPQVNNTQGGSSVITVLEISGS